MTQVPKLHNYDWSDIRMAKDDGCIKLYNNKSLLGLESSPMTAPYGLSDMGLIKVVIPEKMLHGIEKLDKIGQQITDEYGDFLFEGEVSGDDERYDSVIHRDENGTEMLHLRLTKNSRVFDRDKALVKPEDYQSYTSAEFKCVALLDLSKITVFQDKARITPYISQLMILSYCTLPKGCIIFNDEEGLKHEMENRKLSAPIINDDDDAVIDFDPDVNELLN